MWTENLRSSTISALNREKKPTDSQMARRQPRALVRALASRERDGRSAPLDEMLTRRCLVMNQVLSLEDCAVLLGFSSDGNHLLYYSLWESSYVVLWKRMCSSLTADRLDLPVALRLQVGKQGHSSQAFGDPNVGSRLRVWQSSDDRLVAVVSMDRHIASQNAEPTYHFTLSPSPSFCATNGCHRSSSLSFSYTLPSPTQALESWQLQSEGGNKYLLMLNMGSSMVTLVLFLRIVASGAPQTHVPEIPRVHFEQRAWYSQSEFPMEFTSNEYASIHSVEDRFTTLNCLCQQEFDYEAFLASFFRKYAAFRDFHLVDYDFRLVRTSLQTNSLFVACTADLESSPSMQQIGQFRLALLLTLEIHSGEYHIVRALKVPRYQPLRQLSTALARKFLADLTQRHPLDPSAKEWNNDPVMNGESLEAVHNHRFPISIYLK